MKFKKDIKCELSVGQLCYSKQGRDKGKVFIVYEIVDEDYILLVDGKDRTIDKPKKKNIKHLQKINEFLDNFEGFKSDATLTDLMIKRFISVKLQEEA